MRTRHLAGTAMALLFSLVVLAKDDPAPSMPLAVVEKLVEEDAKFIQKTLAKAKLTEKNARKVKAAALLIAACAQLSQDKSPNLPFWRDTALKLIAAIDEGKPAALKGLSSQLGAKGKGASADLTPVPLNKQLKLEYVMRVFSSAQVGGFGIEKDLETLIETKGALSGEDKDKALTVAYKTLAIAHLAHAYLPEQEDGKKSKKSWLEFSGHMHKAALNLATAVNAGKDISAAADKLSSTCTKCHDVFR